MGLMSRVHSVTGEKNSRSPGESGGNVLAAYHYRHCVNGGEGGTLEIHRSIIYKAVFNGAEFSPPLHSLAFSNFMPRT